MPKRYPAEFRQRAVALITAERSVADGAAHLEGSQSVLYKWREQELVATGAEPGLSAAQAAQLVAANRRIRELEAEHEISRRPSVAVCARWCPKAQVPVHRRHGG